MLMSMRSIFAAEAGCSTGSTLLQQLHHVFGAIPFQLFLDLDSDETNGVVLQRDRNRHVLQLPSGRRGQHRQLSPECQRHVGEGRTPFALQLALRPTRVCDSAHPQRGCVCAYKARTGHSCRASA